MKTNRFSAILCAGIALLGFTQCNQNSQAPSESQQSAALADGIKIAYVEIDTLLANYDFFNDLSEDLMRKEENSRLHLAEEAEKFQKDYEDFQKKLNNNVFSSQARAEQEATRLQKKQNELQELNARLSNELNLEGQNNNQLISDSIQSFLKAYNQEKGYSIILSKVGDNILLIDPAMNITAEVIEGLNARYNASK